LSTSWDLLASRLQGLLDSLGIGVCGFKAERGAYIAGGGRELIGLEVGARQH
jgi:hypothetical protein